jgi:hypothetical protein
VCMSLISVFDPPSFCGTGRVQTKWAAPLDLPGYFQRQKFCRSVPKRQSINAVHQLYGYMTFNENKYGVSNLQYAWSFNVLRLMIAKAKACNTTGRLIWSRLVCPVFSEPLWASSCSCPPGFTLLQPLPKHPLTNTSVHLAQLLVTVTAIIYKHNLIVQPSWLDHMKSCDLIHAFAISTVVLCVIMMLRDEAVQ